MSNHSFPSTSSRRSSNTLPTNDQRYRENCNILGVEPLEGFIQCLAQPHSTSTCTVKCDDTHILCIAPELRSFEKLEHLSFADSTLTSTGVKDLCKQLPELKSLRSLSFSGAKNAGSEAFKCIVPLLASYTPDGNVTSAHPRLALRRVDLSYSGITTSSVLEARHALLGGSSEPMQFSAVQLPTIEALNLGGNQIGSEAGNALAQLIRLCPALRMLSLARNQLGNEGTEGLSTLFHSPSSGFGQSTSLHTLDISGNQIYGEGLCMLLRTVATQWKCKAEIIASFSANTEASPVLYPQRSNTLKELIVSHNDDSTGIFAEMFTKLMQELAQQLRGFVINLQNASQQFDTNTLFRYCLKSVNQLRWLSWTDMSNLNIPVELEHQLADDLYNVCQAINSTKLTLAKHGMKESSSCIQYLMSLVPKVEGIPMRTFPFSSTIAKGPMNTDQATENSRISESIQSNVSSVQSATSSRRGSFSSVQSTENAIANSLRLNSSKETRGRPPQHSKLRDTSMTNMRQISSKVPEPPIIEYKPSQERPIMTQNSSGQDVQPPEKVQADLSSTSHNTSHNTLHNISHNTLHNTHQLGSNTINSLHDAQQYQDSVVNQGSGMQWNQSTVDGFDIKQLREQLTTATLTVIEEKLADHLFRFRQQMEERVRSTVTSVMSGTITNAVDTVTEQLHGTTMQRIKLLRDDFDALRLTTQSQQDQIALLTARIEKLEGGKSSERTKHESVMEGTITESNTTTLHRIEEIEQRMNDLEDAVTAEHEASLSALEALLHGNHIPAEMNRSPNIPASRVPVEQTRTYRPTQMEYNETSINRHVGNYGSRLYPPQESRRASLQQNPRVYDANYSNDPSQGHDVMHRSSGPNFQRSRSNEATKPMSDSMKSNQRRQRGSFSEYLRNTSQPLAMVNATQPQTMLDTSLPQAMLDTSQRLHSHPMNQKQEHGTSRRINWQDQLRR